MKNNKKLLFWALVCSFMLGLSGLTTFAYAAGGVEGSKELLSVSVTNQKKKIQGTVKDANGEGLVGASIVEKGTTNGTIADVDGNFTFNASVGAVVKVSSIGFHDKEFVVDSKNDYVVVLDDNTKLIDEVVVVGYGTMKKQNLTGSVSAVNFDEAMASRPTMNLSSALTGLSAGLNISQTSGTPGSEAVTIRVRGQGSLNDPSPLVIIDGVQGALNDINPSDVESVSVLKDAASSSIYGSRAANGVILVTTKRGSKEKISVNYNGYVGWQSVAKSVNFINDFPTHLELVNEASGGVKFPTTLIEKWREESAAGNPLYPNTDWYDEMLNTSVLTEHNLSIRGGAEKINFNLSLGYLDNKGIIDHSGFKKYNFRLNVDARPTTWFEMGGNIYGSWADSAPINVGSFFDQIRGTTPGVIPVHEDGRYGGNMFPGYAGSGANPRAYIDNVRGNYERQKLGLKFYGRVKFFKYLEWENSFGFNYDNRNNWEYYRPYKLWDFHNERPYPDTLPTDGLFNGARRDYSTILNTLLRFNYSLNKEHNFSALVGFDQQYNRMDMHNAKKDDILGDDAIYIMDAGVEMKYITGSGTDDALRSYFGRINYDYKGKYLLEINARYDGSSRFAKDNRWGFFPSFSAGWRVTEESFAQFLKPTFDDVKLRASWGKLGNNRIGDYNYQLLYSTQLYPFDGKLQQGLAPDSEALSNSKIKWEATAITNLGIDFTLLQNRLSFSFEYYNKVTTDLLARVPVPLVMGKFNGQPWQNIAEMRNRGVEIQATYHGNIGKDFRYSIGGNLATVSNKVTKYVSETIGTNGTIIREGKPFQSFYMLDFDRIIQNQSEIDDLLKAGYKFETFVGGVPQPGDMLYKDTNGDKIFNAEDRVVLNKSPLPKVTYGINLNMEYKGFDLNVVGQGVGGVYGYWGNDGFNTFNINDGFLMRDVVLKRWTPENKTTKYPKLREGGTLNNIKSSYWLYNTSYFRIKSIQLGYTLPKKLTNKFMVDRLRVYTNLENYFTFTSFEGYNPENPSMAYPLMKQWVVGLNVTF